MNKIEVKMENCYGISSFDEKFDFSDNNNKVYAVYAPNGLMKSSFARTFEHLAKNEAPKEERYNRDASCNVIVDDNPISNIEIYVLKSEIDISADSPAITNILVDPSKKARYDALLIKLDESKKKLINSLQQASKVKKTDIEQTILKDWSERDFNACIVKIQSTSIEEDFSPYEYATLFDPKVVEVLKSSEFIEKAVDFNKRYQELFSDEDSIYTRKVFNPSNAETSFSTLDRQGFFSGGHKIHLKNDASSIDKETFKQRLDAIHKKIDGDDQLKKIRANLAKNAQTQALTALIESLDATQIESLLDKLQPKNQAQFRKDLWTYYIQKNEDAGIYVKELNESKDEISSIEADAAASEPKWKDAVELFNNRFVDLPFTLSVASHVDAVLGRKTTLLFEFIDGDDSVKYTRSELKTLSQGEKRALYLLNFIFEVEERKLAEQQTLFVIDDVADSFDYKNKHAIIQYLKDLTKISCFYQIILTHNFDFFRSLANNFVHRKKCFMANKEANAITLTEADGINNIFIKKWKNVITSNKRVLYATIPFTRNIIEYTKGESDEVYLFLTSLLHWKKQTATITVGDYLRIYNGLFSTMHDDSSEEKLMDLLFVEANSICNSTITNGLELENKVLLSIAIRMKAEIYLTKKLREHKQDDNYWCCEENQFGKLIAAFEKAFPNANEKRILEQISITVSSNIHLNSFMYEPILDLTIEHLISLYKEVGFLT